MDWSDSLLNIWVLRLNYRLISEIINEKLTQYQSYKSDEVFNHKQNQQKAWRRQQLSQ